MTLLRSCLRILPLVSGIALVPDLHAQRSSQIFWSAPSAANWDVATNWNRGFVPGSEEYVYIGGDAVLPSGFTTLITRATIGYNSPGTLTIEGGTLNTRDVGYIGYLTGSTGLVTVNSGAWNNLSHLYIGSYGNGTLVINGGTVSNTQGFIAERTDSRGDVIVNGGAWNNTYEIYIGHNGVGTLTINGGTVTNTTAVIGVNSAANGARGTVTVNGGLWNNTTAIYSGWSAPTTINLNGGTIRIASGTGTLHLGQYGGSSGTLNVGTGTTAGTLEAAVVSGVYNAAVNFNHTGTLTFSPKLTGWMSVTHLGTGTTTLANANTYSGTTTFAAGILRADVADAAGSGAFGNGGSLRFTGGTLQYSALSEGTDYATRFKSSTAAVSLDTNGRNVILAGIIDSTNTGGLAKLGTGTLTLSGTNTYTGGTVVRGGTLTISSDTNLGAGTLTLDGGALHNNGNLATAQAIVLGTAGGTLESDVGFLTLTTPISGTGALTKSLGNYLTLHGNQTYAGNTTVLAGTLKIDSGSLASPAVSLAAGASLLFSHHGSYAGTLSGAGELRREGLGTTTLTGTATHVGGTFIDSGTLQIGNGGTTGSLSGNVTNTGALTFNRSDASTYAGVISGTGSLTKLGDGSLTLSGNHTYTGGTTINAGTLIAAFTGEKGTFANNSTVTVNSSGTLSVNGDSLGWGSGSAKLVLAGGTLSSSSTTGLHTTVRDVTMTGGRLTTSGTGRFLLNGPLATLASSTTALIDANVELFNNPLTTVTVASGTTASGIDLRITSVLNGAGSLVKNGTGTMQLSGANSYSGSTTINGGTLALSGDNNRLPTASTVFIADGAVLDLGGTAQTLAGLGSAANGVVGNISNGTVSSIGSFFLKNGTYNATFSGSGTNARLWIGGDTNATVTLNGSNDRIYTADNNQVIIGHSTTGAAGTVKLASANALAAASQNTQIFSGTLDLNGQSNVRGNQISFMSAANGSLINSAVAATASFNQSVTAGAGITMQIGGAGQLSLGGALSGTGALNKIDTGTLTLSGANTYTGATTVTGGTLRISHASGLGTTAGGTTVNAGATLDLNAVAVGAEAITLSGIGASTNGALTGTGTSSLSGAITLAANTSIGGTGNTLTLSGTISESGGARTLTKLGSGTLILSGSNTYTGPTSVDAGRLIVNGSASASAFTVNTGATLSGSGIVGVLTLNSGSTFAPGNSSGTLTVVGNTVWNGGATYRWEITDADGAAGTAYDLLSISGALTIAATAENRFTLSLVSLTAANEAGELAGFDATQNYTYTIASAAGGISGFATGAFAINTDRFAHDLAGGLWSLAVDGQNLNLHFTAASPIPEPSTYAALFGVLALGLAVYRRRP